MLYTKQGDTGSSSLGRKKLSKSDIRFELLGNIDELSSFIGLVKARLTDECGTDNLALYIDFMKDIQANLSIIAASIYDSENESYLLSESAVSKLESKIDYMQGICRTNSFVYFGGCELSARLDLCRSVARRTERSFCSANTLTLKPGVLAYLNRLSDFLFAFARYADYLREIEVAVKKTLQSLKNDMGKKGEFFLLDIQECIRVCAEVQERAKKMNLSVAVAFCDASGNPVFACSMQGALVVSFDYAIRKAFTAAALKMPTGQAQKLIQPGEMFYGLKDERLLAIPGGVLIKRNGEIVGGLGISGGDGGQDEELSEYGASLINS